MAGESGANGKLRRRVVANLANNQNLRVLSEQMPRGFGKIQTDGFIDFCLHRAGNNLLNRVFDGDDMSSAGFGELPQTRVNRGCLAAAGWTSEQHQASRLAK